MHNLYEVNYGDGMTLSVFAVSLDEAVQLFAAWIYLGGQNPLPAFKVQQQHTNLPQLQREHLAEALARSDSGIGHYSEDGWSIVFPLNREGR